MLQQLINSLAGPMASTISASPMGYGINNIPPQATFGRLLNSLTSSFGGYGGYMPQAGFGGGLPINGMGNYGALQTYTNIQRGFEHSKNLKAQALAPGAVVVDSGNGPMPQTIPPTFNPGLFAPNQLAALNPLQGSTYQNSPGFGSPQGTFATPFAQGQYPMGPYMQGGYGKIQLLLMPLIGVFTLVKSLFGLRSFLGTIKPTKIDRNELGYRQSQESYNNYQEGSFDEYEPDERERQTFNIEQGLQGY